MVLSWLISILGAISIRFAVEDINEFKDGVLPQDACGGVRHT